MLTTAERRTAIGTGLSAFAALVVFVALAVYALFRPDLPPSQTSFWTPYTMRVLRFTLLQAGLSTLLSIGLAVPVALALARRPRFPGRLWILRLMAVPMGLPALVAALGLITVWGTQGMVNDLLLGFGLDEPVNIYGLGGILLAHVFFNLPLACRLMVASLDRLPGEYWMLAAQLGMKPAAIFLRVEWPALSRILPGIGSLIFMLCATSFTLVLVLGGGPAATTLEVAIYQALRFDFDPARAMTLALLQIGVTAVVLAVLSLLPAAEEASVTTGRRSRRFDGRGTASVIWDAVMICCATLMLLLPLGAIVWAGVRADLTSLLTSTAFRQALATSTMVALSSSIAALLLSGAIIGARLTVRETKTPGKPLLALSAALGTAPLLVLLVPPVVLGTGWFLLLRPLASGSSLTAGLVVSINTLMALPFVIRVLEPAMQEHRRKTGRLAASLGISGWARIWRIDRPALIRPALLALSFAMSLSLGDLGAVALFASNDFVTLPWLLYSRLSSYRTADADGLALLLGALCLVLTLIGTSGYERRGNSHG
nr:thiamine/thiamine pyrophosphate ABC transporter, permease protein [Rhizobium sp. Q54]